MNIHSFIDQFTIGLSAMFLSNSKFFRESIESPGYSEHLKNIKLQLPVIEGEEQFEVKAETPAGELNPAFRIAQWLGKRYPVIIYHHGSGENPYDRSFNNIFRLKKQDIRANLIVIRAPFNRSPKEYTDSIKQLSNFTAMLSVSVKLIEQLISRFRKSGSSEIIVSGISLGGWVTNLHHTYFNSADVYKPLMAGAGLAEVFLDSIYKKLTHPLALNNPDKVRAVLNFDDDFSKMPKGNVLPLLGRYDQFIRFDRQSQCYDSNLIAVMDKGHITGALAYSRLRDHIIKKPRIKA